MPVPTNLSAATALVITTLPYSITLDAYEVPDDDLWFRYDKTADGYTALSLAAPVPIDTGTYVPRVDVYTGTAEDLDPYLNILAVNVPLTVPLQQAPSISYYFRVSQVGGAFTEQLEFQLIAGPVAAAPAGSIAINDDTDGFPMAIVSAVDGSVLQSFPFPAGENAAALASGVSMWHDRYNHVARVYSPTFELVATVDWSALADHPDTPEAPMSATATTFYIADRGRITPARNAEVTTVSATGVIGDTVWDLGAYFVWAIAPSLDDAILYYFAASTNAALKRWDLVNDVALSDLVAGPGVGTASLRDILVLADGSIVVGYKPAGAHYCRRYNNSGGTLNTYTMSDTLNRITHAGDGTSFWTWEFLASPAGYSRFSRIRASDGVVLESVDAPSSTGGVWQGASPGEPAEGHSTSCPFFITPGPLPAIEFPSPEPPEPTYRTRNVLIRRLRQAPHLSAEQKWGIHHRIQLDLQTGVGLNDGQGEDPQLMLQWSDDGGHTWSDGHWQSAGRMGQYSRRALWRRLGRSRDRIYRVTVSDPVAWHLIAAYLDVAPGTH